MPNAPYLNRWQTLKQKKGKQSGYKGNYYKKNWWLFT